MDDPVYGGELRQLNVWPADQRRGIGRLLLGGRRTSSCPGHRQHARRVLRINPNRAFYERLGARYVSERPYDWDGVVLVLAATAATSRPCWATDGLRAETRQSFAGLRDAILNRLHNRDAGVVGLAVSRAMEEADRCLPGWV